MLWSIKLFFPLCGVTIEGQPCTQVNSSLLQCPLQTTNWRLFNHFQRLTGLKLCPRRNYCNLIDIQEWFIRDLRFHKVACTVMVQLDFLSPPPRTSSRRFWKEAPANIWCRSRNSLWWSEERNRLLVGLRAEIQATNIALLGCFCWQNFIQDMFSTELTIHLPLSVHVSHVDPGFINWNHIKPFLTSSVLQKSGNLQAALLHLLIWHSMGHALAAYHPDQIPMNNIPHRGNADPKPLKIWRTENGSARWRRFLTRRIMDGVQKLAGASSPTFLVA